MKTTDSFSLQTLAPLIKSEYTTQLEKILFCSPFVASQWQAHPEWCQSFFANNLQHFELSGLTEPANDPVNDLATFMRDIRLWRMQQMTIIAARDILDLDSPDVTCRHVSELANEAVHCAQEFAIAQVCAMPLYQTLDSSAEGFPSLVALGMGKLGGFELNYSSDIDLMYFYDDCLAQESGNYADTEWQPFFVKVVRLISKIIGEVTIDGFVFRFDLRLRPFGEEGALAINLNAVKKYYSEQGRDWERYALIKAKPLTGTAEAKEAIKQIIEPFVYKRYMDFGAMEAMRDLKARIVGSHPKAKEQGNLKLGRGGIREIEFIFQVLQLTYGNKNPRLKTPSLAKVAEGVERSAYLSSGDVSLLLKAYWFLRKAENGVQMMRDEQTHCLPSKDSEEDRARLMTFMGFDDEAVFEKELDTHQLVVAKIFDTLLTGVSTEGDEQAEDIMLAEAIWQDPNSEKFAQNAALLGYKNEGHLREQLVHIKDAHFMARMSDVALQRLDRFMLELIARVVEVPDYEEVYEILWQRIQFFIKQVAQRSSYLSMLTERPKALSKVLGLFAKSAWVAETVSSHPVMLNILLEPVVKDRFSKEAMKISLDKNMLSADSLESQLDIMRRFKHEVFMKVASTDLQHQLPLTEVSDSLTYLSENLLETAIKVSKEPLLERFGEPAYELDGTVSIADLMVVGYGKMGGLELSYTSDLDIVFLHDSRGTKEYTNGEKQIDNTTFFARWVQKTVSSLNTLTHSGRLYEVDMRLRPNGAAGTMASRMHAYENYLRNEAWLWELQSLVRARFVAGNKELGKQFEEIRKNVLTLERQPQAVREKVVEMRQLMRTELGSKNDRNAMAKQTLDSFKSIKQQKVSHFDLKHDFGGIADIEFMVQYSVLANAAKTPALAGYTDNIRLLELMAENRYIDEQKAQSLISAYQLFRQTIHHRSLQNQDRKVTDINAELAEAIDDVSNIWLETMNTIEV